MATAGRAASLPVACAGLLLGACAFSPSPRDAAPAALGQAASSATAPSTPPSDVFESDDFLVTFARSGDTAERLAARLLGDPRKAWVIEDYNGRVRFSPGQEVVIPKGQWNLAGVDSTGYQLVPVLVYHNVAPRPRGRLVIPLDAFGEQMRYLKQHGYRVVSLSDLYGFISFQRQLPRRAVVLSFDDGYRSFLQYAYPILKELGFTATLFVYTDYVGGGHNALTWDELRKLLDEGFDVQAHSKTHRDLRRKAGEPDQEFTERMEAELGQPQTLFRLHLGRTARILAYPYGAYDDEVIRMVKEYGYGAAFSVRREANPSFVYPLRAHRSQIYANTSLEEFAKILNVFSAVPLR